MPRPELERPAGWIALVAFLVATVGCSNAADPGVDPGLVLPVAVGLQRQQDALQVEVLRRSTPAHAEYLSWLTPSDVRASFGTAPDQAQRVLADLRRAGFVGDLDPGGAVAVGSMTASQAAAYFGIRIVVTETAGQRIAAPDRPVVPPKSIASTAREVVGLSLQLPTGESAQPSAPRTPNEVTCPPSPGVADRLTAAYGLRPLAAGGGAGVRLALLSTDQVSQRALEVFSRCFDVRIPPVTENKVDASAASIFGDTAEESTLDIAAASLAASSLSAIDTYRFNPYSSIVFPMAAAVAASAQQDGPQIISTSIGFCEKDLADAEIAVAEWLILEASAIGVTTLAAAGDTGSSGCAPADQAQAAQYPASSPNVTAIGGTDFGPGAGVEHVWNNAPGRMQAGGGTTASRMPRPAYQEAMAPAGGRLVPDVAFIAAPAALGPIPVCTDDGVCSLKTVGGTSATAPGVAGALADVASVLGAGTPRRLGLVNPTIYAIGRGQPTEAIHDVTIGTNDLYATGCCTAVAGYDTASGWGSLHFDALTANYRQYIAQAGPSGP